MANNTYRIGTRGSKLALHQANMVANALANAYPTISWEISTIASLGDIAVNSPLESIGSQGIFTNALEIALSEGIVDVLVHSAKDLPSSLAQEFVLAAFPAREDARDCLVSRDGLQLDELGPGARIGTSSPRRSNQLRYARHDLELIPMRGNVDTRRRAALEGAIDAAVLAVAGLRRLELFDRHVVPLPIDACLPQAGQGALAVEARACDQDLVDMLAVLDHTSTRACVEAERAVLARLSAGCQAPIGAYATIVGATNMRLDAVIAPPHGALLRATSVGAATTPITMADIVARQLLEQGGEDVLGAVRGR